MRNEEAGRAAARSPTRAPASAPQSGRLWLLVAVILLASCEASPPTDGVAQGPALATRDSAGIAVVEFDLDRHPPLGSVAPEPNWIFGQRSDQVGGIPLADVRDAHLFADGRVGIINGLSQEVLVVHPEHAGMQRLGGMGEGPSEFEYVVSVSADGDGIGVFDQFRRRWVRFSGGQFVSGQPIQATGVPGPPYPEMVMRDGPAFVIADAFVPPGAVGGEVTRRLVLIVRVEEGVVDTLTMIRGDTGVPKFPGVSPMPFVPDYGLAVGEFGIWTGDTEEPEVRLWDRRGDLVRIVRWSTRHDRALTDDRVAAYRDRILERRSPELRAAVRENFEESVFPDSLPAWGSMVLGIDGVLWIGEYPGPEVDWPTFDPFPPLKWWGVDAAGTVRGAITSPPGLQVTGFASNFLIGIHMDSLGVQTVRRHSFAYPRG